jgi:hypothetical protein
MDGVREDVSEEENRFGDYAPQELLAETEITRTWLARQVSVGRMVLLEELKEGAESGPFIADVRAKAGGEHPLVASIYEASMEEGHCHYAHELLPGETLGDRARHGERIRAQRFVHILRRVAEANIYHESHGNATSPLGLDAIHVDNHGVIRLKNLVIAGDRLPEDSLRDVTKLGGELAPILDTHQPGATRSLTLLAWMRGEDVAKPLKWTQIRDYCEQIEQQLTAPSEVVAPPTAAIRPEKKSGFVWVVSILLVAVIAGVFLFPKKKKRVSSDAPKPGWVAVQAGHHEMPDGMVIEMEDFVLAACEVTVGDYAEFLETLDILAKEGGETAFDHPEQPETKTGHTPEDWENLYRAARQGGEWGGREINIHSPVVGVDWWDAFAYAKWKKSFLPTQEQWLGALMAGAKVPSQIPVSDLLPVNEENPDRTTNGLLGMAGSVSEWTGEPRPSASNPLGEPLWVIVGGSYLNPGKGALTREWTEDRMTRRPDLGFRIGKDSE